MICLRLHGTVKDMPQAANAERSSHSPSYKRHRPEQVLFCQIIERHHPVFWDATVTQGKYLPLHVQQEFADYLKSGRLEHDFLRVQCNHCHHEYLVAFSCKRRGFCPSCGARRMAESAALLVNKVLPRQSMRQLTPGMACSRAMRQQLSRVLSFPFQ